MNSKLFIAAVTAAIGLAASPVSAESFDGPYLGVQGGWSRTEIADQANGNTPVDGELSRDSFALGGYAGYNWKIADKWVIGTEAGFSGAFDDDVRGPTDGSVLTIDPRYSFDLTARAGLVINDQTLAYVRAGYTNTRLRTDVVIENGISRSSENLDGWLVGGGVERAITDNISTRLEYRYSDFSENGGRYDRHQTLVGISYNF